MGGRRIKDLKSRVEALHWQRGIRWTRLNNGGIQDGGARRRRHSIGRCETSIKREGEQPEGQIQEWELPRVLNLEKKSSEYLKWIHLE